MATNLRGRGGSTYGSMLGRHPYGTVHDSSSTWGTTTGKRRNQQTVTPPPQYRSCSQNFVWKIDSFRTLYNQTRGPAKYTRPTPSILNNFANWINKGAVVQIVSRAQVAKWARSTRCDFNSRNPSTTACKDVLTTKFGKNTIKAVARTKSGSYMVATTPTSKGKPFSFPRY